MTAPTRIDIVARVNAGLAELGIHADADPDGVREVCGPPANAGKCNLWGCTKDAEYERDNVTDKAAPTVRMCLEHAAGLLDKKAWMAKECKLRRIENKRLTQS